MIFGRLAMILWLSGVAIASPTAYIGDLYVATFMDGKIQVIPTGGGAANVFASNLQVNPGTSFPGGPIGLAFDGTGGFYASRFSNQANQSDILHFSSSGAYTTYASGLPGSIGLTLDNSGNLFVANHCCPN